MKNTLVMLVSCIMIIIIIYRVYKKVDNFELDFYFICNLSHIISRNFNAVKLVMTDLELRNSSLQNLTLCTLIVD